MPPFEDQPAEKHSGRKIRFLNHHVRDPVLRSQRGSDPKPFGVEPAENVVQQARVQPKPAKASLPFQDEFEEGERRPGSKRSVSSQSLPFQPEQDEDGSSSEGSCCETELKDTVFSLGWQSMQTFVAGSFWKENMDELPPKTKRRYDNSKRSTAAAYTRQQNAGSIKTNGTDPQRLRVLFASPSCQCGPAVMPGPIFDLFFEFYSSYDVNFQLTAVILQYPYQCGPAVLPGPIFDLFSEFYSSYDVNFQLTAVILQYPYF